MYNVKIITDYAQWDRFVEASPQGTLFSSTRWCDLYDSSYTIYGCYNGDELVGGIIGWGDDTYFFSGRPLTPFQGVIVKETPDMKYQTKMALHNKIGDALAQFFAQGMCTISNHWSYPDIRPFLWGGWRVYASYTYVVDMTTNSLENLEKMTRYEVNHTNGECRDCGYSEFYDMYKQTFTRKKLDVPITEGFIKGIFNTLKPVALTNGESCVVFIEDNKRAYYILGASLGGNSSGLLWQGLNMFEEVDMVGCNVREIGLFKRGFGGRLTPYYEVSNV